MLNRTAFAQLIYADGSGSRATVQLSFPFASTVEDAFNSAETIATLINPMSDAVLEEIRVRYRNVVEPRPEALIGGVIKRSGVFWYADDLTIPGLILEIPGIKLEVLETDGCLAGLSIVRDNPLVTDLTAAIAGIGAVSPFGDSCTVLINAMLQSRV